MHKKEKDNPESPVKIFKKEAGFTLTELMFVIFILAVIMAIALPVYFKYLDKARITVAIATLDNLQKGLESYHMDFNKYPASINFDSCTDDQGRNIVSSNCCEQMKKDLLSIDSYTLSDPSYILTAKATDTKHTLLTLTASKIAKEGN